MTSKLDRLHHNAQVRVLLSWYKQDKEHNLTYLSVVTPPPFSSLNSNIPTRFNLLFKNCETFESFIFVGIKFGGFSNDHYRFLVVVFINNRMFTNCTYSNVNNSTIGQLAYLGKITVLGHFTLEFNKSFTCTLLSTNIRWYWICCLKSTKMKTSNFTVC